MSSGPGSGVHMSLDHGHGHGLRDSKLANTLRKNSGFPMSFCIRLVYTLRSTHTVLVIVMVVIYMVQCTDIRKRKSFYPLSTYQCYHTIDMWA
jgi:hypothetical protein